jgi:hypothetical protein
MRSVAIARLVLVLLVAGCTSADNGAVELSWRLRPAAGPLDSTNPCDPFLCCDPGQVGTQPVTRIKLSWQVGAAVGAASFDCGAGQGVTGFEVPEGPALLSVSPVCDSGPADPASYTAPAPEERAVTKGDTVSLGAVELVLQASSCVHGDAGINPCICHP